jgi:GNAT superfamily N-acetyltransferase
LADIDELARLRTLWRSAELTSEFVTAFRHWFQEEQSSRRWWIAVDRDGRAYGMVNIKVFERMPSPTSSSRRWGYLANLFVDPDVRGDGIGAALVQAAVHCARDEGLARLVLSPSELSTPLYSRLGFRAADELMVHPLVGC